MSTSGTDLKEAMARNVTLSDDSLNVDFADGRTIVVPLAWFPRLAHATPAERAKWRLIGGGTGIHWPALDEDVSVASLLAGRSSGESPDSLRRWLAHRGTNQRGSQKVKSEPGVLPAFLIQRARGASERSWREPERWKGACSDSHSSLQSGRLPGRPPWRWPSGQ